MLDHTWTIFSYTVSEGFTHFNVVLTLCNSELYFNIWPHQSTVFESPNSSYGLDFCTSPLGQGLVFYSAASSGFVVSTILPRGRLVVCLVCQEWRTVLWYYPSESNKSPYAEGIWTNTSCKRFQQIMEIKKLYLMAIK